MTYSQTLRSVAVVAVLLTVIDIAAGADAATLEGCIRAALKDSPDAEVAARRADAARAAIGQARSAYYPQLTLSGTYARTDNPPQAFFMNLNQRQASMQSDFNNPPDTENVRGSVGAKWLLYDGGQREAGIAAAEKGSEAAEAMDRAARNDLVHVVTRGFYEALQARDFVTVQEEAVTNYVESLRVATERVNAGAAMKTDQLNLEVKLAQANEDLISASNRLKMAVAAVNVAIGQEIVTEASLPMDADLGRPAQTDAEPIEIQDRDEIVAAKAVRDAREATWRKARREYMPRLSAFASSDWDSESLSGFEQSYFAGAVVEWDFFTGFRRGAGNEAARSAYLASVAEEKKLRNQLGLDLKQAGWKLEEASARMGVAGKALASAEEALRLTKEQYINGSADVTALLGAQVAQSVSRARNVAARYDFLIAASDLERARGFLVTKYSIK